MDYWKWNNTIASYFFNESRAGEKVFLHVDADLITTLGGRQDAVTDFVAAVKAGPSELSASAYSLCRKSLKLMHRWRAGDATGLPPYIAYLASFVLGASMEGNYQNEGYYKRLHRLMGEEATNVPPQHFYPTKSLWDDLMHWANEVQQGRLGIVRCEFVGSTPYVNLPRAQIVLSGQERKRLPILFAAAESDPAAPPTADEMRRIALRHGVGRLEAKTLRRLNGRGGDPEMVGLTVEAILEELRFWDGTVVEDGAQSHQFHPLRINLQITDRLSGRGVSRLLTKDSESFPDEGLVLEGGNPPLRFEIVGFNGDWSTPVRGADGMEVDAATLRWDEGLRLSNGKFTMRMPPRSVRVFRRGEFDGVSGLIEVNRLDPYQEFYVAAGPRAELQVHDWGSRAAANWTRIPLRSCLPERWVLFHARSADPTVTAPDGFPALHTDPGIRIAFDGGLKLRATGRRYFDFAPPQLRVEGLAPGMQVRINGESLPTGSGDFHHDFGESLQPGVVEVEVMLAEEPKYSAAFEIVAPQSLEWRQGVNAIGTLPSGAAREDDGELPYAVGAMSVNFNAPKVLFGLESASDLIGRKVGQVRGIPESTAAEWDPVWLIERGRGRRKVVFCGGDPRSCSPFPDEGLDRKQAREWKRILWYERKNLAGPSRGALAALWRQYKEAARNV